MGQECKCRKRSTIAFFTWDFDNAYIDLLNKGITDAAIKYDVNLIIFPGRHLNTPIDYQYQENVIYDLVNYKNVDALMVPSGVFNYYLSPAEFNNFSKRYLPLPIVCLSHIMPGATNILLDNKKGLRDVLDHLILKHDRRRIVFLAGTSGNKETEERYFVYREALAEHNILFDSNLVLQGGFSEAGVKKAMKELLDIRKVHFDALVSANDGMALTALDFLTQHGLHIPEDISIVGFDNVEASKYCHPPLTTVNQPIYAMAEKMVELAIALIHGEKPADVVFNTEAVIRESCGCSPQVFQSPGVTSRKLAAPAAHCDQGQNQDWDVFYNTFLNAELADLDFSKTSFKKGSFIQFINQVFQYNVQLAEEEPAYRLLKLFESFLWEAPIKAEDGHYLSNFLTRLRNQIMLMLNPNEQQTSIENFFHKAQLLLIKILLQSNAGRWAMQYNDVKIIRSVLNTMVSHMYEREDLLTTIIPALKSIGINNCYVYLYEDALTHRRGAVWKVPPQIILTIAYNNEGISIQRSKKLVIPTDKITNNSLLPQAQRYTMILSLLYFNEEQLGFVLCDYNMADNFMYESLFTEISCALALAYLIKNKKLIESKLLDALKELEEYNLRLSSLSQTDELTGLYNRRGFMSLAENCRQLAYHMNSSGLLFYVDLDGLKKINDNHGHQEGDCALQQTALLLKKVFRTGDIIARLGGDEFVILTTDSSPDFVSIALMRLHTALDEYNQAAQKHYTLSLSIGTVAFSREDRLSIGELLTKADHLLYKQKASKEKKRKGK